jgi:CRP-like cAMP-binding protein
VSINPAELFRQDANALSLGPGEYLFREGDAGDKMFVVLEGNMEITLGDFILENAGPGALIGEMALIDRSPRTASLVAKTPCRLAQIDQRRFHFLVPTDAVLRDARDEDAGRSPPPHEFGGCSALAEAPPNV